MEVKDLSWHESSTKNNHLLLPKSLRGWLLGSWVVERPLFCWICFWDLVG